MSIRSDASVLGLHVTGDQSAAAIFHGGRFVAAVAEERLSRRKRSRAFPRKAIAWCLQQAGLESVDGVDHVVVSWNPTMHMKQINMSGFTGWRRYDPEWLYIVPNNLMDMLPGLEARITSVDFGLGGPGKIAYINHHDAHLGWAFASPFESAAIAVIDEYSESASFTFGRIDGNRVTRIRELAFPHSLGMFYATLTAFLGFTPNSDEWKVMGAAAYGDPARFKARLLEIVHVSPGVFRLNQDYFEFANTRFGGYFRDALPAHLGLPPRRDGEPLQQIHYDLAASCQAVFETALFQMLNWLHDAVKLPRLVMNGGCCMNSLANGKVLANTPFEELFISSAPADNGCCIGAPLWLLGTEGRQSGTFRAPIPAYTGPAFDAGQIEETLRRYKLLYRRSQAVARDTVGLLERGDIVGWFQGRMEFGERALGNR
jgi:carbamoyltransferase